MNKILPIYTYGFDVLRKKTKKISNVDDNLISLIANMYYTMNYANGIGLAAPQIGLLLALTVIDISKTEEKKKIKTQPITLINPEIKDSYGEVIMEEGCLSIPYLRADVARPETIYLEYQDLDLNTKYIELNGVLSRVAQHEIDHLNGILFIDRIDKEQKKILKKELDLIKKGEVKADYKLAEFPAKKKKH